MKLKDASSEKAIFMAIIAFAGFSINDALRKTMSQEHDIIDILFWQAIMGMIILFILMPFIPNDHKWGIIKSMVNIKNIKWHFMRGILIAANTASALFVLSRIPITDAYTIFFLTPFVTSILGIIFLKEAISKYRIFTIIIGFIGVVIAFRPGFTEINLAYLYAIFCVFAFSSASIISRYIGSNGGLLCFAFWPFICLIIGIIIYKNGKIPLIYDGEFYVYMVAVGAAYVLAMLGLSYSYTITPAAVVAPCQYIQIIFAIVFYYLIWASFPDPYKIIGVVIIIGSGIYLLSNELKLKSRSIQV